MTTYSRCKRDRVSLLVVVDRVIVISVETVVHSAYTLRERWLLLKVCYKTQILTRKTNLMMKQKYLLPSYGIASTR